MDDIKLRVGQGLVKAFGPLILQAYDLAKALSAAIAPGGQLGPIFDAIGVAVDQARRSGGRDRHDVDQVDREPQARADRQGRRG